MFCFGAIPDGKKKICSVADGGHLPLGRSATVVARSLNSGGRVLCCAVGQSLMARGSCLGQQIANSYRLID